MTISARTAAKLDTRVVIERVRVVVPNREPDARTTDSAPFRPLTPPRGRP